MASLQETVVAGSITSLRTDVLTTSSKTLVLNDRIGVVTCTNTADITITISNDSTTNFPIGSVVYIARFGSGNVTLAAAAGVTLSKTGNVGTDEELYVRKRAANTWSVVDQPLRLVGTGGSVTSVSGVFRNTFTSVGTATFTLS